MTKTKKAIKKGEAVYTALDLERAIYKKSLWAFYKKAFEVLLPGTTFVENKALEKLCDILQEEAERIERGEPKTKDLLINIPPRTSKTLICSVCYPAWVWARTPHRKFITASYSDKLALDIAVLGRDLVQSEWYKMMFPYVILKDDANNKSIYKTTSGGHRISTSPKGTVTGLGSDITIIDDPQKPNDADSDVNTETVKQWYRKTIISRTDNQEVGIRIIVMQRLSEDDLSGFVLSDYKDEFRHICLPAELTDYTSPEFVEFYKNGLFDEKRLNPKTLNSLKKDQYMYAGQYMQLPAPADGGIFKKESFKILNRQEFDQIPGSDRAVWDFFLDTAFTSNKKNDPSAIVMACKIGNIMYIRDVQTKHYEFPELIKFIKEYVGDRGNRNSKVWIEGKASGQSLIQQLRQETNLNIMEMQPGQKSKEDRAYGVSNTVASKRVVLIEGHYTKSFLDQVTIFPNGKNDDMVDAMVYAIQKLVTQAKSFSYGFS